jgi:hypothetical protein
MKPLVPEVLMPPVAFHSGYYSGFYDNSATPRRWVLTKRFESRDAVEAYCQDPATPEVKLGEESYRLSPLFRIGSDVMPAAQGPVDARFTEVKPK